VGPIRLSATAVCVRRTERKASFPPGRVRGRPSHMLALRWTLLAAFWWIWSDGCSVVPSASNRLAKNLRRLSPTSHLLGKLLRHRGMKPAAALARYARRHAALGGAGPSDLPALVSMRGRSRDPISRRPRSEACHPGRSSHGLTIKVKNILKPPSCIVLRSRSQRKRSCFG